jgi:hypothetical protein
VLGVAGSDGSVACRPAKLTPRDQSEEAEMSSDTALRRVTRSGSGAETMATSGRPTRQSRAVRRRHRIIIMNIGLSLLFDRRFREQAFIGVMVIATLARLAHENEARARARFAAWFNDLPKPAVAAQSRPGGDEDSS